jgi:glutathione S-transferase
MLKLHGFGSSNYHNVAKLALLEKGLEYEEVIAYTGGPPEYLEKSPMGKVPCLETEHGFLSESRLIVDYLEELGKGAPLFPEDPFERAKVREFTQIVDLYLELPARRLHMEAFFGGKVSDETKKEAREVLEKGARSVAQLGSFESFAIGDAFTAADIAAIIHFPIVSSATRRIYDKDLLAEVPNVEAYLARMKKRAAVQKVSEERKADMPRFMEYLSKRYGAAK